MPTPPAGRPDLFTERHARSRNSLSPSFRRVAEFIDANRVDVLTLSALDLARIVGTSDATVVRAVQALGFKGLNELRAELAKSLGGRNAPADNLTRTLADLGENAEAAMDDVLESLGAALEALRTDPVRQAMRDALEVLHVAERIVVFGLGPTSHIAAYFGARLRRKGRRQMVLDRTGAELADQLLELTRGDAILMLAYGKPYPEAEATILEARRRRLPVVLLTDAPEGGLERQAKVVLPVPRGRSGRIALHGATMACLEMLLLGLATSDPRTAIATLGELGRLRQAVRPPRRRAPAAPEPRGED